MSPAARGPRLGIILPQSDRSALLAAARAAEEAGLDSLWLYDHLASPPGGPGPILECWTCLGAIAAMTERISVGTLVTRATLRRPAVLAAMVKTVARVAPGRIIVGLGTGDETSRAEDRAYGFPTVSRVERLRALDDSVRHLRRAAPAVSLWAAGSSSEVLAMAAKLDGWNFWGRVETFPRHRARLEELAGGRRPVASWAGRFPGEKGLATLAGKGADHIIVTAGRGTYRERIDQLARWRSVG